MPRREAWLGEFDDRVDCDGCRRGECLHFLDACDRCLSRVERSAGPIKPRALAYRLSRLACDANRCRLRFKRGGAIGRLGA